MGKAAFSWAWTNDLKCFCHNWSITATYCCRIWGINVRYKHTEFKASIPLHYFALFFYSLVIAKRFIIVVPGSFPRQRQDCGNGCAQLHWRLSSWQFRTTSKIWKVACDVWPHRKTEKKFYKKDIIPKQNICEF